MLNFDIIFVENGFKILAAESILKTLQTTETCMQKTYSYELNSICLVSSITSQ